MIIPCLRTGMIFRHHRSQTNHSLSLHSRLLQNGNACGHTVMRDGEKSMVNQLAVRSTSQTDLLAAQANPRRNARFERFDREFVVHGTIL